jgi:2-polyprenyl-3-methyl-5-hydroxy-6-metoxy-1,4-benzoquinol methylase
MGVEDLRRHYPELKDAELVNVDIIDNGELLSKIADTSLDFIISNHMLEHCQNPLGTIRNHLGKLKPGGIIYMAIPDKRFSFDRNRQLTSFEHIVTDYKSGADCSRAGHFLEWSKFCNNLNGEDAAIRSKKLMEMDYSIHYHVWDYYSFSDFLNKAQEYLCNSFNVKFIAQNKHEIIAVITKPHT